MPVWRDSILYTHQVIGSSGASSDVVSQWSWYSHHGYMTRCSRCKLQLEAGNPLPSRLLLAQSQWPSALEALDIGSQGVKVIPAAMPYPQFQHVSTCFNMFQHVSTSIHKFGIIRIILIYLNEHSQPAPSGENLAAVPKCTLFSILFTNCYSQIFSTYLNI